MGRASDALIFLAQMHQSHDQEIGKEVAALAMGEHNQRFQNSLEFGETWIARDISRWGR